MRIKIIDHNTYKELDYETIFDNCHNDFIGNMEK